MKDNGCNNISDDNNYDNILDDHDYGDDSMLEEIHKELLKILKTDKIPEYFTDDVKDVAEKVRNERMAEMEENKPESLCEILFQWINHRARVGICQYCASTNYVEKRWYRKSHYNFCHRCNTYYGDGGYISGPLGEDWAFNHYAKTLLLINYYKEVEEFDEDMLLKNLDKKYGKNFLSYADAVKEHEFIFHFRGGYVPNPPWNRCDFTKLDIWVTQYLINLYDSGKRINEDKFFRYFNENDKSVMRFFINMEEHNKKRKDCWTNIDTSLDETLNNFANIVGLDRKKELEKNVDEMSFVYLLHRLKEAEVDRT